MKYILFILLLVGCTKYKAETIELNYVLPTVNDSTEVLFDSGDGGLAIVGICACDTHELDVVGDVHLIEPANNVSHLLIFDSIKPIFFKWKN